MLRVARKRADLFGMEMPHLEAIEAEARAEADKTAKQEQQHRSSRKPEN